MPTTGLVCASLELSRALAQLNALVFRAQGMCMYPVVRSGDILRIQPRPAADLNAGDIAVTRRDNALFGHRVIEKDERNGKVFVVTRPDRAGKGADPPTFDENILGVVIAIERGGKNVPLSPACLSWFARSYYAAWIFLVDSAERFRQGFLKRLSCLQSNMIYRLAARIWLVAAHPNMSCIVRLPLNAKLGDAVYQRFDAKNFNWDQLKQKQRVNRLTLTLHLNGARRPAAWATFSRRGENDFCIAESHVRLRYRGMGLDAVLLREAGDIFTRVGLR